MKIKRFIAANMREAMRMVREEQGADAVILSNRRIEGGIEVVAATDYDAALVQQALGRSDASIAEPEPAPVASPIPAPITTPISAPTATPISRPAPPPVATAAATRVSAAMPLPSAPVSRPVSQFNREHYAAAVEAAPQMAPNLDALRQEMQGLRKLVEQQLAGQAWGELKARNPIRADVVRRLVGMGLELKLAKEIAAELPDNADADRARFLPMATLAKRIPAFKHEWLDAGGVVALVGATGVGKTTTIAKLAARYVQHWGLRDVALVTTDHFRIGAQEQLFTYGRLLGVPVLTADNHDELCRALDKLKDRKLVLIDTAGMSPRDQNLSQQFSMLSGLPVPNRTALVLSASSQGADLDDQFQRFAAADPSAVILTKLDEATRVGAAMSSLIRHNLPLAYVADGQRVPEDLAPARPDQLVLRAMNSSRKVAALPDDEELSIQFAGAAHA